MTKENFITQKLHSYKFKKNAVYSSMKISEILKLMYTDSNGNLKSALSKSRKWQHLYGRTWKYVGETNDALVIKESAPIVKQTAPIKEVGLIRKFIKWIY
jgi:DNA polymerase II small subunit/DNA polymerase delta subunit B